MIGNLARKYEISLEDPEEQTQIPVAAYKPGPALQPVDRPWEEFPTVMELSNSVRQNKHHGIELLQLDGQPVLHFQPPLDISDQDRVSAAHQVLNLFHQAADDLQFLLDYKLLPLRRHPGY